MTKPTTVEIESFLASENESEWHEHLKNTQETNV